ncbi:MAG: hypothetical protein PGN34_13125 [Methylobacterium frigidaeris]
MYGRMLPPLQLSEFTADVLEEAIEYHLGRLQRLMNEERDRADRMAWARVERRRAALNSVRTWLWLERNLMGPMAAEDLEQLGHAVAYNASRMPRSAANAETLKAERAERIAIENARKAAAREARERNKRIMGQGPED